MWNTVTKTSSVCVVYTILVDYYDAVDDRAQYRQRHRVDPNDLLRLDEEIAKHIREEEEEEISLRLPSFYRSSNTTSAIADYAYREPDATADSRNNRSDSHPHDPTKQPSDGAAQKEVEEDEEVVRPFSADDEQDILKPATAATETSNALTFDADVIAALHSPAPTATKPVVNTTNTSSASPHHITASPQRALSSSDLAVSQRIQPPPAEATPTTQTLGDPVRTTSPTTRTGRSTVPRDTRTNVGKRDKGSASFMVGTTALSATGKNTSMS